MDMRGSPGDSPFVAFVLHGHQFDGESPLRVKLGPWSVNR